MRSLSALQLLEAWEQGAGQPAVRRALVLLAAACPDESLDTLACLSIGQRDARLLTLREWTFGAQISSITECPACHERLDLSFKTSDLRPSPPPAGGDSFRLDADGYQVTYRLPNSLDVLAAVGRGDTGSARQVLIERCLLEASRQDAPLAVDSLPVAVIDQVTEQMRMLDPQAEIELALKCSGCGHAWTAPFDILDYFWREIETWNQRILQEVHRLARAYGWSERDILQMSAWRRRSYLEMIER